MDTYKKEYNKRVNKILEKHNCNSLSALLDLGKNDKIETAYPIADWNTLVWDISDFDDNREAMFIRGCHPSCIISSKHSDSLTIMEYAILPCEKDPNIYFLRVKHSPYSYVDNTIVACVENISRLRKFTVYTYNGIKELNTEEEKSNIHYDDSMKTFLKNIDILQIKNPLYEFYKGYILNLENSVCKDLHYNEKELKLTFDYTVNDESDFYEEEDYSSEPEILSTSEEEISEVDEEEYFSEDEK